MSKYMKISNSIEVEPNAFKLLGACTKREDNSKIGYFGSGLKYAMAVFMRDGINLRVFAGDKEVVLGTVTETFRDQTFNVITVDGEKTSLTTGMGVDWKIWQAIREIYCNALDEEDCLLQLGSETPHGEAGKTAFYLEVVDESPIAEVIEMWDKFFSSNLTPLVTQGENKVFEKMDPDFTLYRRGIRCYESSYKSLYNYDIYDISINESRLVNYGWQVGERIANLLAMSATSDMIISLIDLFNQTPDYIDKHIEANCPWTFGQGVFNTNWRNAVEGKVCIPYEQAGYVKRKPNIDYIVLPLRLIKELKLQFGEVVVNALAARITGSNWVQIEPDQRTAFLLTECKKFFNDVNLPVKHDIIVAKFEDKQVLGLASTKNQYIVLSERCMDMGRKTIVCTILEEWSHLESGMSDETRGFQDFLIGQIITNLENQHGIFL